MHRDFSFSLSLQIGAGILKTPISHYSCRAEIRVFEEFASGNNASLVSVKERITYTSQS